MPSREHLSGSASPTERTMAWLRGHGYIVGKVECRDNSGTTHDLFGFADILAYRVGDPDGSVLVQATDDDHFADHAKIIRHSAHAAFWVKCGNRLWVVCWDKHGAAGRRKVFRHRIASMHDAGDLPMNVIYNEGP